MGLRAGLVRCGKSRPPPGFFVCAVILYWSRYGLYIFQSILSRQSFAGFKSRYLSAEGLASDAPCLPIGFSSLCFLLLFFFFFFFFFLGRCHLLCCSYVVFEALGALDASTWKSQRSEASSAHQQGFNLGLIRGCSGNCPPVLSGSVSDKTCTWIAVRSRYNPGK